MRLRAEPLLLSIDFDPSLSVSVVFNHQASGRLTAETRSTAVELETGLRRLGTDRRRARELSEAPPALMP
jgi:hypothetical protein